MKLKTKEKWELEYEQWKSEPVKEEEFSYLWADGIYVKVGIGKEKRRVHLYLSF